MTGCAVPGRSQLPRVDGHRFVIAGEPRFSSVHAARHILATMSRNRTASDQLAVGCRETPPAAKPKPAPTITRLVPDEVTEHGYRLGTIEGDGFDTKQPVKVWFGTTLVSARGSRAKTKIQVEIPPGTNGSEVPVRVEIAGYEPATAPAKLRYISYRRNHEAAH